MVGIPALGDSSLLARHRLLAPHREGQPTRVLAQPTRYTSEVSERPRSRRAQALLASDPQHWAWLRARQEFREKGEGAAI